MAFGTFDLTSVNSHERYPASGTVGGKRVTLRLMDAGDGDAVLAFARGLPEHDLLFLRRDITQPEQVETWVQRIETGVATSLLVLDSDDSIAGYATVDRNDLPWSQHVAELRVLVGPALRGRGIGRLLTEEAFRIALGMGVDKIIGQMTVDQHEAIAVFRSLGFQPEALLRDHVKDRAGEKHDLVILSHDVAAAQRTMAAVGVLDAVEGN
ncbi:MAG: GNAT family N-acetyltransferase [Dehalococcoidia bacterium]|nr:GNAT family N-acetyltransferase [Chloroflexota bacterium]MXW25734.1 GNAT family N-acetyltransferase [Dehalococcoidia bacterium]MYA53863.1 GNAT family N-acetyltransferase [Dehalococcoidia bacterium]